MHQRCFTSNFHPHQSAHKSLPDEPFQSAFEHRHPEHFRHRESDRWSTPSNHPALVQWQATGRLPEAKTWQQQKQKPEISNQKTCDPKSRVWRRRNENEPYLDSCPCSYDTNSTRQTPHSIGISLENQVQLVRTAMASQQTTRSRIKIEQQGSIFVRLNIAFNPTNTGITRSPGNRMYTVQ